MADAEDNARSLNSEVGIAGTGRFGQWKVTAWVTTAKPDCWLIEIERAKSLFSDFSFSILGPEVVGEVLRFIQQTIGSRQYSDRTVAIGSGEVRPFACPKLTVGRFASIPVELYKDGAEDRYFLVVAQPGQGALRFVILDEELRDFMLALQQLKEELDKYTAEPEAAPDRGGS
jgi:hypothetical protein